MRIENCEYPDDLLYDVEGGTWGKRQGALMKIGLTPRMSWAAGGFTFVSFKVVGTEVAMGANLGSVEGPKKFDVVRAPFSCVIKATNGELREQPKLANRDPFGAGWFAKVEQVGSETRFQSMSKAAKGIEASLKAVNVRCFKKFPDLELFELGTECSATLVKVSDVLESSEKGTVLHLVSDNPTSPAELEVWSDSTGNPLVETRTEGDLFHFIVEKN